MDCNTCRLKFEYIVCLFWQTPFKRMARRMDDLSGDGGVLKKVLRPGTGPVVPSSAVVRGIIVHLIMHTHIPITPVS